MNTPARALLVFTRSPRAEAVAKGFDADRGAALFRGFLASWAELASEAGVALVVSSPAACLGEIARSGAAPDALLQPQLGKTFGARLADAAEQARRSGFESLVVIGGDVPAVSARELASAFDAAERGGFAVGPSADGGIYLIGLRADAASVLGSISPRNPRAAEDFLSAAAAAGSRILLLDVRDEIDSVTDARRLWRRSADLAVWRPFRALLEGALPSGPPAERTPSPKPTSFFAVSLPPRAPPLSAS